MARDIIIIGAMIFALALAFFVTHFIINQTVTQMIANPVINESTAAVQSLQGSQNLTNRFDYVVFGVFIGFVLAMIITGWFIGGYAIFMMIYFIFVIIAVVMATILANIWESVSTASIFGATVAAFPITNNLMTYLPMYMAIIGGVGILVMFAKPLFIQNG
jgi:hypothetical protein